MVTILMMSAKITTPGLLKIRVFWNNGYDVIIFVHDVTNKILSRDSNYIVDVVMWPKLGNFSISVRKVIIASILWGFTRKLLFSRGGLGSSSIIWDCHYARDCHYGIRVKTKSQKVLGAKSYAKSPPLHCE